MTPTPTDSAMTADDLAELKRRVLAAIESGADRDDVWPLSRDVWRVFDRAAGVRHLIDRAEKAEAERTKLAADLARVDGEREALKVATTALEFYADPYDCKDEYGEKVRVPDFYDDLDFDGVANAALETIYALAQPAKTEGAEG